MPYAPFHELFPEIAREETRTIIVFEDSGFNLPPGEYAFVEMFCNEPRCDCRRVFFYVLSSFRNDLEAVIAWGWESPEFYARWMGDDDPRFIAELKGPVLNLASPQSSLAPDILKMAEQVLLKDEVYVERVKRHYRMFRDRIDGNTAEIKSVATTIIDMRPLPTRTEKINSYKFHQIPRESKKEFETIRKGTEDEYLFELLAIEQEILKFYMKPENGPINDARVTEAIKICLFRIRGYLTGVSYDCGNLVESVSMELADRLAKTFDPFIVQEIRVIALNYYHIESEGGLRKFFEIPVKCFLRILDSVEDWTKMGVRGYLEYLKGQIGSKMDLEDDSVHFYIRMPEES